MVKSLLAALLVLGIVPGAPAQPTPKQPVPDFAGRRVTVIEPELFDEPGVFPKGPASVCIEGPPQRQCYTMPNDFGRDPTVSFVQVEKELPALLFTAGSGGVSGWAVHFALVHPGTGNTLEDLFLADITVDNQNQHGFLSDPSISPSPIFLVADYVSGPDEGHYGEHRFIISSYVRLISPDFDSGAYFLADQYMTVKKYDLGENADIIASEKQEILSRLKRVKAELERQKQ